MISSIFKNQSFRFATVLLMAATSLSYILGLLRDRVFAHFYGAGSELDAYYSAFLVPDLIFNIFAAGILSQAVFIPVYTEYLSKNKKEEADKIASSIALIISLLILTTSIIAFLLMPFITQTLFPRFDITQLELTTNISRLMLLTPILFGLSSITGSINMSYKHYTGYAFSPAIFNLAIIITTYFGYSKLGNYAAVWGLIIGVILHLGTRLIDLFFTRFSFQKPTFHLLQGMKQIFRLGFVKMFGLLATQGNIWIITILGGTMAAGSISIFNYTRNIQSFPVSFIGISLATAVLPILSEKISKKDFRNYSEKLWQSIRIAIFFSLPSMVGIILLSKPIVTIILGTGEFGLSDINRTSVALALFAIMIPGECLLHIYARGFYALQNTFTPVVIAIGCTILTLLFALSFTNFGFGINGLILAWVLANIIQVTILAIKLKPHLLPSPRLGINITKVIAASLIMGLGVWLCISALPFSIIITTVIGIFTGIVLYFASSFIFKSDELKFVTTIIKDKKFFKKSN